MPATGRLTTFVAPRPCPLLIRGLVPVNRVVCLSGLPGLRRIPGVRGLADVVQFDFPAQDAAQTTRLLDGQTAVFIAPNHPEFSPTGCWTRSYPPGWRH